MSAQPTDTLSRLIRAADAALRLLFGPLAARLRRFLLRLRGRTILPSQLTTVRALTTAGFRLLVGASPVALLPLFPSGRPPWPLARLLRAVVRAAVGLVLPAESDKAAGWEAARLWVDPAGRTLSQRLWRDAQLLRARIDRTVADGLRAGTPPSELATRVERLLLGDPGDDGRGMFRRLFDTEATRAYGLATIQAAGRSGRAVRWVVRTAHALTDECGRNASRDGYGLGPGVYPADRVPSFPAHPWCRCKLLVA